jgi:hypothetical protein
LHLEQESNTNFGTDIINSGNAVATRLDKEIQASREYEARLRNDVLQLKNGPTSVLGREMREHLRRIIDDENMELTAMESHLNTASDVILMLHHPSQHESLERLIQEDDLVQKEKKQRLDMDGPNYQDHEMQQLCQILCIRYQYPIMH